MRFVKTTAVDKILAMKKRLKIIQGGTSAGKTIATLLILIDRAMTEKGKLISVVSETLPHLRRGAMRDFLAIMENHRYYEDKRWNKSDLIYTFHTGTRIEFFSADQPGKVRGPRRNDLFINEANNVPLETFTQLAIRTDGDIYIDYNPVKTFWVHEKVIPHQEHDFIILTYKDNEALSQTIVNEIESRRHNKNFWKVYGLGEIGELEGQIYRGWTIVDGIPHTAAFERFGLDYGYSNDPSAIVAVYRHDGGWILDEVCYQKGLSNKQLSDVVLSQSERPDQGKGLVVADSAEPKSIDEMKMHGVNITAAEKGKDSVNNGIQLVQDQRISVTKRSVNLIREYRNYLWETDRDGKVLNVPEHHFSHSMDAVRYAMASMLKRPKMTMKASDPVKPYYDSLGF